MLSESYFNGERLRMYLSILEEYKQANVDNAYVAVKEDPVVVVSVVESDMEIAQRKEDNETIYSKVDIVQQEVEENVVDVDFSCSTGYQFLVGVCDNASQLNDMNRVESEFFVKAFDKPTRIILRNGQWSKERVVNRLNLMFVSRRTGHRREMFVPAYTKVTDLERLQVKSVVDSLAYSFEDLNGISRLERDFRFENDYDYWVFPNFYRANKVLVVVYDSSLYVMRSLDHVYKHVRDVKISGTYVFQTFETSDGKLNLLDVYHEGLRYEDRREILRNFVLQMSERNDKFAVVVDGVKLRFGMSEELLPCKKEAILMRDREGWDNYKAEIYVPIPIPLYFKDGSFRAYDGNNVLCTFHSATRYKEGTWECFSVSGIWNVFGYLGAEKVDVDLSDLRRALQGNYTLKYLLTRYNRNMAQISKVREKRKKDND